MKIVVFDTYQDISAKDHDRMKQASGAVLDFELSNASHLMPKMKNKSKKWKFANF